MRRVPLKNETAERLVFPDLRNTNFEAGETKWVYPALLKHPTIARRLGRELSTPKQTKVIAKVEEPKAPQSPPVKPVVSAPVKPVVSAPVKLVVSAPVKLVVSTPVTEPIAGNKKVDIDLKPKDETRDSLREALLVGPGVTTSNVDAILAKYPTLSTLSQATKQDLLSAGVAKSYASKLLTWAAK